MNQAQSKKRMKSIKSMKTMKSKKGKIDGRDGHESNCYGSHRCRGGLRLLIISMALATVLAAAMIASPTAAEARSLMPYFEQESWLAYAVFAAERDSTVLENIIRIRDDNYRFIKVDPSFAIRTVLADWIIAEHVAGKCVADNGLELALLETLSKEVKAAVKLIPKKVLYRMPVLVLSNSGVEVLKQLLPALRNELPVSAIATRRWNSRLPLAAVDVAANAIAPYVICAQNHGTSSLLLDFRELSADRKMAEEIAEYMLDLTKTAATNVRSHAGFQKMNKVQREDLTEALLEVVMTGQ